jgi:RimJ/RimL family protein N-acetyltransferase
MEKTVYFRAFEEEDASLLYQWMNDDGLKQLSVGLNKRVCREEVEEWIKARKRHNPYQAWFAICALESKEMIGYMCLTDIHYINSSAYFSGIIIGDPNYRDGQAYIESYLFMFEYAFERLNLNRLYGSALADHKVSITMAEVMYQKTEGVLKQAIFKNGKYHDEVVCAILKDEYYQHKENGDFEMSSILKRILLAKRKK